MAVISKGFGIRLLGFKSWLFLTSYVTLKKSLDLIVFQFPHLKKGSQKYPSHETVEKIKVIIYKMLRKMSGT